MSSPCSTLYVRHMHVCSPVEDSLSFAWLGSSSAARPAASPWLCSSPLTLTAHPGCGSQPRLLAGTWLCYPVMLLSSPANAGGGPAEPLWTSVESQPMQVVIWSWAAGRHCCQLWRSQSRGTSAASSRLGCLAQNQLPACFILLPAPSPCQPMPRSSSLLVHLPFWFISLPGTFELQHGPEPLLHGGAAAAAAVGREGDALHPSRNSLTVLPWAGEGRSSRVCYALAEPCLWAVLDGCPCFASPQVCAQASSLGPSSLSKHQGCQGMLASFCFHQASSFQ